MALRWEGERGKETERKRWHSRTVSSPQGEKEMREELSVVVSCWKRKGNARQILNRREREMANKFYFKVCLWSSTVNGSKECCSDLGVFMWLYMSESVTLSSFISAVYALGTRQTAEIWFLIIVGQTKVKVLFGENYFQPLLGFLSQYWAVQVKWQKFCPQRGSKCQKFIC